MKLSALVAGVTCLLFSTTASAFITLPSDPSDTKVTQIENPQLVCQNKGVMFALNFEKQGKERIWQADPGDSAGLELTVDKFEYLRCPYCYNAKATLQMAGEKIAVELTIRGKAVVSPANPDDISWKVGARTKVGGERGPKLNCTILN